MISAPEEDVEPVQLRFFAYPKEEMAVRNEDRSDENSITNSDSEISGERGDSTEDETYVHDHDHSCNHSLDTIEKK